ncbi:BamA/TamA family outer membrane protein [Yokenella regensburgei]|uniref:BamA/TamA family outer membrane protein n=1 Tax=Yokenella regensburgei TaxID=158877 RepID=UPI0027D9A33F|nr:BamA/TamA family outer membrane protein [Yokenella regensburgei]MDQ4428063.1 BamA/TamA family outer membrane protein [Yokenella regensburgei]
MRAWHGVLAVVLAGTAVPVNALLPDRKTIDELLAGLGADNKYDPAKGIDWSVLPGPFYTPELKVGLGMAVAGLYRVNPLDTTTQNSSISFSGFVSTSGALGLGFKNYTFFTDDKWRLFVEGNVNKIPTGFWGIGYDAAQGDEQKYTNNSLRVHPMLLRELADNWYAGVGWDFSAMSASVDDPHPGDNFSRYGAQTLPVASGMAFSASYDTRDVVTRPQHGQYFSAKYTWFDPALGSDSHFSATELQYNYYHPMSESEVLAFDLWGRFTEGDVPWDRLSMAGDDQRLRGYYQGRYRDNDVVSGQVEYRKKLSWRHGYVLWLGAGALGDSPGDLSHHPLLPTVGAGYRFEVKPAMNIRLDLGIGKESAGFYFQVAEAF